MEATGKETLIHLSATALAAMIARGDISSVEAVEAYIERIERVNPDLNAVVVKRYEAARAEARTADALRFQGGELPPLHGVPLTIKESLDLEGTPSTFGLPSRASILATRDDPYVARIRAAGAIILGKTNVSQLLLYTESDNPVYGRSNNPWNLTRTPGGSSGGQAAIIAAGGSSLGLGTDIGGSLRYPAAFSGVASLKPTAGRTPDPGRYSVPLGQRAVVSQVGVLARRVEDIALGLEIINGGRYPSVEPPMPLGDPASVDVSHLRVGYYIEDGTFQVAPAVRRAVLDAVGMIRSAGAQVQEWAPPDARLGQDIFLRALGADGGRGIRQFAGHDKRDPRIATLELVARRSRPTLSVLRGVLKTLGQPSLADQLRNFGYKHTHDYWQLIEMQMAYQQRFRDALDQAEGGPLDVLLCPAVSLPAWTHGAARELVTAGAYANVYNTLGYPTGVVQLTRVRADEEGGRQPSRDVVEETARKIEQGSAGLPIGVQIVARPWREHIALAVMSAIEQVAGTRDDYPAIAPLE